MNPPQHATTYGLPQQQKLDAHTDARTFGTYTTPSGTNMPPSTGPLATWVPPSPEELQFYDELFLQVDEHRCHRISGSQAVAFFRRSHLDQAILREIWQLATTTSNLTRTDFYVAMRLISMAQHGEPVTLQRFHHFAARHYPLPRIEGVFFPARPAAPYTLDADAKRKYDRVFQQYDTDQDGFLQGTEAVSLFQLAGLDRRILREIWSMADVTQDSKLDIQEFYVAMHLIVCVSKRGLPMPSTLPQELREAVFGTRGTDGVVSGHALESHTLTGPTVSPSGLLGQQQERARPSEPEGMSAFDSLSIIVDAPLQSLSTPRSSQKDSSNDTDANTRNSHLGDFHEPPGVTPTGSEKQHTLHSLPPSRTPSVVGRDRTNSASSLSSMSSFSGLASLPSQQSTHQLPSCNLGSNDRVQMQADNPDFQAYPALGGMVFGELQPPATSLSKPFMGDEEEKKLVCKLDQQNKEVVQAISSVERKQSTIETVLEKLRDIDELRNELATLVTKRKDMRAASACTSELSANSAEGQTRHAVERSLRSLVENQKLMVHQLQGDISRYEGELEEAILSAKLQQRLSLESRSPRINAATPPVSAHDSSRAMGGGTTAFAGTPLILDRSNALLSPVAVPNSPDVTDSSSNFHSAPRSLASATPSPANTVTIPLSASGNDAFNVFGDFAAPSSTGVVPSALPDVGSTPGKTQFSSISSPSQSVDGNDMFNVFGEFAAPSSAGIVPSALPDAGNAPENPPFSPTCLPAVASDSAGFDDFSAAAQVSAADAGLSPSLPAAADATSTFSPFSPSSAVIDDSGFSSFGHFEATSSLLPVAVATSSPAVATSSSTDFSKWEPTPSNTAVPVILSTSAHASSPFSPTPSPAATKIPVFDAFATISLANDDTTPSASTTGATESLVLSPVTAASNGLNACGDVCSIDNAAAPSDLLLKQEISGDLLFSPTPSPVAATEITSFDTFGDFSAPPTSSNSAISVHASKKATGNSTFALVAADSNDSDDFNNFDSFNAAQASADRTFPLSAFEKPAEVSSNSPFSPAAKDGTASGLGDFSASPTSTYAAATPSELSKTTASNGSLQLLPVIADSSESGSASDITSAPVTVDSTKSAEVFDGSSFSPVSGEFEVIGDFEDIPTTVDSMRPAAEKDTNDINGFGTFNDINTAPSDGFDDFDSFS